MFSLHTLFIGFLAYRKQIAFLKCTYLRRKKFQSLLQHLKI